MTTVSLVLRPWRELAADGRWRGAVACGTRPLSRGVGRPHSGSGVAPPRGLVTLVKK